MDDSLYVVIYRNRSVTFRGWKSQGDGVFTGENAKSLAINYAEVFNAQYHDFEYRVACGTIIETPAEADAQLGKF